MAKYEVTKDRTLTSITRAEKSNIQTLILNVLKDEYGEDNVSLVRTNGKTPATVIGIRAGTLKDADGFEQELVFTSDVVFKTFKEKVITKGSNAGAVIEPFDFEVGRTEYASYLVEQEETAKEKVEKKANSPKAQKEKALAERKAELEVANAKAEENRKAKLDAELNAAAQKRAENGIE